MALASTDRLHHLDIQQVRSVKDASCLIEPLLDQRALRRTEDEINDCGCIDDDQRESRSARMMSAEDGLRWSP